MVGLLLLTFCLGGSFTSATPAVRTAAASTRCAEIPSSIYKCLSSPKIVINDDLAKSCDTVKSECDRIKCIFSRSGWVSNGQLSRPAMSAYFSNFAREKPEWRQAVEYIQRECLSGVLPPQGVHMECPEYDVMHCTLTAFIRRYPHPSEMFEGAVAGILNRILGKYVQDLDTENLNMGIFSGSVNLTDLKLKPEALYELDLPIDVKIGTIGRISFQIPWTSLYTQPVVIHIEDVLVLVGPAISNSHFDPEREKRLMRAAKRKILQDLEEESEILKGPQNFFEHLFTAVVNNLQIYVRNVHVRYEDSISSKDGPLACGLCMQTLSIETTNNKWKPSVTPVNAPTVYQMMKIESLSLYWNPTATVLDDAEIANITPIQYYNWKHYMLTGLDKFSMHLEDFEFLLKPVTCKVKVIMSRSAEARVPRLLLDAVLQDSALQLSRRQYLSVDNLMSSFTRIKLNRKYRHLHPGVPLSSDVKKWWRYAYNVVVEQRVRPYTWTAIQKHRKNYNVYKKIYKSTLKSPNDTELKLDLQQCEDSLPIVSVVIAREQAKFELLSEEPARIEMVESEPPWWSPSGGSADEVELCVRTERRRGVWSHLSSPERRRVCELIGIAEGGPRRDRSKQCIEHKLNLTLANCSLTLTNRNKEILVVTLTQFLASLETRPSAKAYKLSARTESIVIEGISSDGELVPMVTAERGATNVNLIALDIEKNPAYSEADYALTWIMEPIEVLYVEHAITELINLIQTRTLTSETVLEDISVHTVTNAKLLKNIISNRKQLQLNIDVKAPCVLLPEFGCMHKSGRVLVVDISRISVKSDLQPAQLGLEDATCMELEERLYDRLHAECSFQVLFSEWRDRWRELRRHGDSELHLVPRMKATLVFSNSIKKDYKLLPRYKLNISLNSLRLNLSGRIISHFHEFLDHLPLPSPNTVPVSLMDSGDYCEEYEDVEILELLLLDKVEPEPGYKELKKLKSRIVAACLRKSSSPQLFDKEQAKRSFLSSEPVFTSSDHSEEEMELYARNVDLPGFDDNVSASNTINTLLRFVIGEVVINLSHSTEHEDHPYLMMSVTKICLDVALMEYGPALQFSIGEALITDKQHHTSDGQYLELLTTTGELLNVIYRKVRADCPEFRSDFHSVECALVADAGQIDLVLHADSLNQLKRLPVMLQNRRSISVTKAAARYCTFLWEHLTQTDTDPPVPSGATKFSYSIRAAAISALACTSAGALVAVRARGAAADCVFRADDRAVRRLALAGLHVDDVAGTTLYPKLVWTEDDKVLEVKWSKRAAVREGAADGELKVTLGRIHVTVLCAVIMRLQLFIEPLIPSSAVTFAANMIDKALEFGQNALRNSDAKLNLVINLHAPVLLIPQKASSPSLLIFNTGDLTIENYFKKCTKLDPSSPVQAPFIDNILLKWENITLCRAVMTLAQTLEVQEPILEPVSIRCDMKRCPTRGATLHLLEAAAGADRLRVNLGQRDIATIAAVCNDNCIFSCLFALGSLVPSSPDEKSQTDATITKLQEFFSQGEPVRKEVVFRFSLEGVDLKLYTDMDEVLSSPVRDVNHALAGLNLGEGTLLVDSYSDGSVEMRASLQSFLLEDIRNDPTVVIKRIFQSQGGSSTSGANIAVSRAPFLELSYRSSRTGQSERAHNGNVRYDRAHNVNVRFDRARLNVAVPFLLQLLTTLVDHHTGERNLEGGLVNPGYVGDVNATKGKRKARAHSSSDSTSGYYSQATSLPEETSSLSVSIQFCQPEIMFFTDSTKSEGHALLLRTELLIDYSSHSNTENLVISLAGLQMMSKLQSKLTNLPPQLIIKPCDVEFSKSLKSIEEGVKINLSVSEIEVHLAPTTVHTVIDILDEVLNELTIPDEKELFNFATYTPKAEKEDDLWSPKKLTPLLTIFPCEDSSLSNKCSSVSEHFAVTLPRVRVLFEIERAVRVPVCVIELSAELTIQDFCSNPQGTGSVSICAYIYNDKLRVCEPLIEPSPWTLTIEIVQGKSYPMSSRLETNVQPESDIDGSLVSERSKKSRKKMGFESETSAEENESDCETILIRNPYNKGNRNFNMDYNPGPVFLSAVDLEGSDSDYEGRLMDKLTTAIGHLFDDDSSSSELSNDEDSSEHEVSEVEQSETEETLVASDGERRKIEKTVTLQEPYHDESSDSDPAWPCTYWAARARAPLLVSVGGGAARALAAWGAALRDRAAVPGGAPATLTLANGIGPGSTVHLRSRTEMDLAGHDRIIAIANYDDLSRPSTPGSAADLLEDAIKDLKREQTDGAEDWDCFEGGFGSSAGEVQDPVSPVPPAHSHTVKPFTETLAIKMQDFDDLLIPCPQRTISKLHVLHPSKNNTRYYVAVERTSSFDGTNIVVRSPLQVRNETSYTLDLFYKKSDLESVGVPLIGSLANPFEDKLRIAVIAPHDTYNVSLYVAYHCKLYLMPNNFEKYQSTTESIWWVDLAKDAGTPRDLTCSALQDQDKVFALRVVAEEGINSHKITRSIPNFLVRVVPPLAIYNRLPYAINVTNSISKGVIDDVNGDVTSSVFSSRMEAGDRAHVYTVKLAEVQTMKVELSYMGMVWTSSEKLTPHLTEKTIHLTSEAESESESQVEVRVKVERGPTVLIYFYTPYIFVNKTGLPIQIKVAGSERVYSVGAAPLVAGGAGAGRVRLRAQVTLSELCPQLTKIVSILPYFLIYNDTKRHLRYMEENEAADLWFDLAPQQCSPFWPQTDSMMMHCKYRDSGMVSQHFPITKTHFTVLRMDKGSAICVDVAGGLDRPFTITFKPFTNSACVRIDNLCDDLFLKLHQEDCGQVALLSPYQSLLYTWDDPAKERILIWNIYNNKGKGFVADISQDGFGEEKVSFHSVKNSTLTAANSVTSKLSSTLKKLTPKSPEPFSSSTDDSDSCDIRDICIKTKKIRKDKAIVYWISYMEGHQRVFALTQDERIAFEYKMKINAERSNCEICLSLPSVGLSICIDTKNTTKELMYISVLDSIPRWEVNVGKKWKQLSPELTSWIEEKFQADQTKFQLKQYIDIDLEKMQMTKPFFSELRRTYSPGVWLQIRKSETSTYYHLKLQSLQVDNQLLDAVFPTVLHPTPLPPDLRSKRPQKPSVEILTLKEYRPNLNQEVYKYFKILVQEYNVNLDRGFVSHVFEILNHWKTEDNPSVRLRADLALLHMPLPVIAMKTQTNAQTNVSYEFLHLSPIKIILSLSSRGYSVDAQSSDKKNRPKIFNSDLLEYLFDSWGSSLSDMKDVVIRMSYLEIRNAPIPSSALMDQASRHYMMQLIQQYYVLVLGITVLGNPYSYIGDFTKGLKMYYEPYLGVISSVANNYAESLFTRPKIETPSRFKCRRKPDEISEDLPSSVIEQDRNSPASIALALTGLIARPSYDEDSYMINVCRSAAKLVLSRQCGGGAGGGAGVGGGAGGAWRSALAARVCTRARLPRYCHPTQGIVPFSLHSALGLQLLHVTSRGAHTYLAHAHINHNHLILVTTGHVSVVRAGGGGAAWVAEWAARLDDVIPPPLVYEDKLVLNIKQDEEINYFATDEKIIDIQDPELLLWIKTQIEYAIMLAQEDKRLPADGF